MRDCCSHHLVFSDHQKFRFPLLQRWIRCTFSQPSFYITAKLQGHCICNKHKDILNGQEKRIDFTKTSEPKWVNRMVIFLDFLYASYTRLLSTKEAGVARNASGCGPQNKKKERKDSQNRKGTAPQDRKPLDNYYSAPATYHRKKLWPQSPLCLQSLSEEPRFPDSLG